MIAFLNGTVAGRTSHEAYIDVRGVGYEVFMSQDSLSRLPETGQRVHILTYLQVSDNGLALFGFLSESEATLFKEMIAVSGVGPKMALAALSTFSPKDLIGAIVAQDVKAVSKIPGVGKKSASRIILELKDKFPDAQASAPSAASEEVETDAIRAVREGLGSMGFTAEEVAFALKDAPADLQESALLQYALKRLSS